MKTVITCAMWKRPALTNYVFQYYSRLQNTLMPEIDLRLIAVGSEGDKSRLIAERNGFSYIEYDNAPRNRKLNAVIREAKKHDPDILIPIGSDDIISADYFRNIEPQSDTLVGLRDLYFLEFNTKKLGYWSGYKGGREGESVGPGRCFSRGILERCDWQPWSQDEELMSGIDASCRRKMFSLGIKMEAFKMEELGCFAVDIKKENNLWSWNAFEYERIIEGEDLRNIFEPHGISDIFDLNDPEKDPLKLMRHQMYCRGHQPHTAPGGIEVLRLKINKHSKILETGAGISTLWFAQQAASVESFEHAEDWFKFVLGELKARGLNNVSLHLDPDYPKRGLDGLKDKFDIIFIDGRGRCKSILTSAKYLKPRGLIILDDADRDHYSEGKAYLDSLGWARMQFKSVIKANKYALGWMRN